MEKYFNIAGLCTPGKHYMLSALDRLPVLSRLVEREQYFVIHAACQTGKTTAMLALVDEINARDTMAALYFTVEAAQPYPDPEDGIPVAVCVMASDLLEDGRFKAAIPVDPSTGKLANRGRGRLGLRDFSRSLPRPRKSRLRSLWIISTILASTKVGCRYSTGTRKSRGTRNCTGVMSPLPAK